MCPSILAAWRTVTPRSRTSSRGPFCHPSAVSSPNLDLVRSIYADWERGDFSRADWAHPQIEYVFVDGPHPGTWIGVAEMATAQRDFLLAWEDWRIEAEECRALDDERVLVHTRMSGRGRTSGVQLAGMQQQNANVFNVRSGKVVRLVLYWDRERAFADLGLAREADVTD
jgi:ketosteroid isomerase-like protein